MNGVDGKSYETHRWALGSNEVRESIMQVSTQNRIKFGMVFRLLFLIIWIRRNKSLASHPLATTAWLLCACRKPWIALDGSARNLVTHTRQVATTMVRLSLCRSLHVAAWHWELTVQWCLIATLDFTIMLQPACFALSFIATCFVSFSYYNPKPKTLFCADG